jgi:enoyl-CoA hydratase
MMFEAAGVQVATVDTVGILTLNRPRSIKSLTHSMVRILHAVLTAWADDPDITAVFLQGAGDRGLCAGGDIVGDLP